MINPYIYTEFMTRIVRHSLRPDDLQYNILGLMAEAGEAANNVKKILMVKMNPQWATQNTAPMKSEDAYRELLTEELGDALFYLARVAKDNGVSLSELMERQIKKLEEQSLLYERAFLK